MHRPHLEFALSLHDQLPASGNLPWSPYSVASALGLAAAGAAGRTRAELVRLLAPGGDIDEVAGMLAKAASPREAEAAVSNTLWMRQDWPFRHEYQRQVRSWPGGQVRSADFAQDPEGARTEINTDVARTTRELVQDLLAEGTIHPDVVAVIVNALYLKVAWLMPFPDGTTVPAPFHAPSGRRQVQTMRQQETFPYAQVGDWRLVTLPSAGEVVVDVLLPDGALADTALSASDVVALHDAARPTKVDLELPRFRIEAGLPLSQRLQQLGVTAPFDRDAADFSGITEQQPVWLEQVIHKAVLRVDEQGFEGAAATAMVMRTVSMDLSRPVPFHVDRPFVVLVRHARTGAIYFLARVVEP